MKRIFILFFLISFSAFSQKSLHKLLKRLNKESVPYISVDSLQKTAQNFVLLDAREPKEFKVSHLKNAIFVGYKKFKVKNIAKKITDKNTPIVVYCSLGIRSEDVAEQLKKAGYINVFNLYGGIFEWKNNNLKVYNSNGKETENVHTFNKDWSKWLKKGKKIYE